MTNIQEEIWKDIAGYEGIYLISNLGRVQRKAPGLRINKTYPGKILTNSSDTWGYQKVALHKNGKSLTKRVHRLVAIAFHENPLDKPTVNHKNGIKTDNQAINLEWCTVADNNRHAHGTGLYGLSEKSNGYLRRVAKRAQPHP